MRKKFLCWLILFLLLGLPNQILAQDISILAKDGNVYIVPMLSADTLVAQNFTVKNESGEPAEINKETAAKLYSAVEAMAAFQTNIHPISRDTVVAWHDAEKKDKWLDVGANIAGIVTNVISAPVQGAVSGAAAGGHIGYDVADEAGVGKIGQITTAGAGVAIGGVTGGLKGVAVSLVDAASTLGTVAIENTSETTILTAAYAETGMAQVFADAANKGAEYLLDKTISGQPIDLEEIKQVYTLRRLSQEHDSAAIEISQMLEKDISASDLIDEYVNNAQTGASTLLLMSGFLADASFENSDSLQVKAALVATQFGEKIKNNSKAFQAELFGVRSINDNVKYLAQEGFYTRQEQQVTDHLKQQANQENIRREAIAKADAKVAEAQRQAEEAAQKKAETEAQAAALQKDLDIMGAEMSSLASKLAKTGNKASIESALEKSKKEYDDSRSRQRMLSRQVNIYKDALKQLTGTIKTYEVTISGQVFRPKDVPSLQQRVAEQSAILTQLENTFSNPGGLKGQYEAARQRLDAFKQIEKQQAEAQAKLAAAKEALKKAQADAQAAEEALKNNQALVADLEGKAAEAWEPEYNIETNAPLDWGFAKEDAASPDIFLELGFFGTTPEDLLHLNPDIASYREDTFVELATERRLELERSLARNKVDVFFLADNTGSMGGLIEAAQANAKALLDALTGGDSRFTDVEVRFGIGAYNGDPVEAGETALTAYQLLQPITNDKDLAIAAIDSWEATGGGDWEEANFFAIQQAATDGAGVPRDGSSGTGQATGWRSDASKIIVVFGDAPSWQNTVNEKELGQVIKDNNVAVVFIDTSQINVGSTTTTYDATSGQQMSEAAKELADLSGGAYSPLADLTNVTKVTLDAVYDSIADNHHTGGILGHIGSTNIFRQRTPSSVTASTPDGGDTISFTLKYPGLDDSTFTLDTTGGALVSGKNYYASALAGPTSIFGREMLYTVWFNDDKDFFQFILNDDKSVLDPTHANVAGYYGERIQTSAIPANGIYRYDMYQRSIGTDASKIASATNGMQLYVDWETGSVVGIENESMFGTSIFIGEVDKTNGEISGSYLNEFDRYFPTDVASIPKFIKDSARGNTNIQLYGNSAANGLGGTFGVNFYDKDNILTLSSLLISGFVGNKNVTVASVNDDTVYKGFAAGFTYDVSSTAVAPVTSGADPENVKLIFKPSTSDVKVNISLTNGSAWDTGYTDDNAFISPDVFAIKNDDTTDIKYAVSHTSDSAEYDYFAWGEWGAEEISTNKNLLPGAGIIAGQMTPGGDIPVSGSATYSGNLKGQVYEGGAISGLTGTVNLNADFGSRALTGTFDNIQKSDSSVYAASADVAASWGAGNNSISGGLTAPGMTGSVNGAFFGPVAQEVGGSWRLDKNDNSAKAAGTFAAKQ